jgi:hypothetical protein
MTEFVKQFQSRFSLQTRQEQAKTIQKKYPNRIPVIVDRARPQDSRLKKNKFLVPYDITLSGFAMIVRKRLKLEDLENKTSEYDSLFFRIYQDGSQITTFSPAMQDDMSTLYRSYKSEDGFLILLYSKENTFG